MKNLKLQHNLMRRKVNKPNIAYVSFVGTNTNDESNYKIFEKIATQYMEEKYNLKICFDKVAKGVSLDKTIL